MATQYRLYAAADALGGHYPSPLLAATVDNEQEAARYILGHPDHHAIAPNGDILCFDGEAVVREPAC